MTPPVTPQRPSYAAAVLVFAAAWTALAWPWLSGAVTIPWDAKAHFYPQLQFLAQSLHRAESPFWAPFVFAGTPQIADPQSLIFSPPFLALAWFDPDPSFQAFDGVVLGSLGIGGLFVLLLFRDRSWHPAGAALAALAFAFGASAAWRVQHVGQILSLAAWPASLFFLMRGLERGSAAYGFLAGVTAGIMALGRDQVAYLGLGLLALSVVDFWIGRPFWRRLARSAAPLLAGLCGGAIVAALPVLLTFLLAEGSNRPAIDAASAGQGSLHPALLLTAAIPNLFGVSGPLSGYWGPPSPLWGPVDLFLARNMGLVYLGALPLALIFAGFLRGAFFAREIRFVLVGFVVMLLYALGRYTPAFEAVFPFVPGMDLFRRPADAAFFVGALGALLAGYAAHRVCTGTIRTGALFPGLAEAALLALIFTGAIALALSKNTLGGAARAIAEASVCFGLAFALLSVLPHVGRPLVATLAVAALLTADLAWNNGPNESTALPPATYEVLRPDSRNALIAAMRERLGPGSLDRVELAGLGFHWPNASLVHRLHNTLGYNPLRLGPYARATGAGDHAALPEQRGFSALMPSYRSALADMLGLRFIATGVPIEEIDRTLKPGDLPLVARTADGFLYENARAWPRASFVTDARAADVDALIATGAWPAVDLARTVLLPLGSNVPAASQGSARPASRPPAPVRVASYGNTDIVLDVTAPGAGYVVLNDPYHPWWQAELDGRAVPLLRANGLFRAVQVPAGSHRVRFVFAPFSGAWHEAMRRWPDLARLLRETP